VVGYGAAAGVSYDNVSKVSHIVADASYEPLPALHAGAVLNSRIREIRSRPINKRGRGQSSQN
jgi:hypothetical protein